MILKKLTYTWMSILFLGLIVGCTPSASSLKKAVENDPDILFVAIEKNPEKFLEVVNKAAREAQMKARQKEEDEEKGRTEEEFKTPKQPVISENRAIHGKKDAPITIVEYSDFECPFCSKGFQIMNQVKQAYGDKIRIVFKNLPLDFHPQALPAAKYFEAIALQNGDKAYKFHDEVFSNQNRLKSEGEKFLKSVAQKVGADMKKLAKDVDGEEVKSRIQADMEEAKKFGFSGTPGFLINGVSVRGALPFEEFKAIIDRHLGGGKQGATTAPTEDKAG
jgi:protein-disulfide isomerase